MITTSNRFRALASAWMCTMGSAALLACEPVSAGPAKASTKRPKKTKAAPLVAVTPSVQGPISSFYRTTCTLEAEKVASVQARVQGVVRTIAHEEGDAVRAGQLLLQIENDEYRLRVDQLATETARLKDRFKRLEAMVAKKLIGFEELEEAKYDLKAAEAAEGLARLELSYTSVRAPFAGRLVQRTVDIGQTVKNETALFELADLDPLLARVFVPSKTFRELEKDQPVELVLDSNGTRLTGKIKLVSPVIDPTSGTIKVTVEVSEYPEDTRPGDFAQVHIVTAQRQDAVLVPRVAVVETKRERVVFVAKDGKAHRKVVDTGFEQDNLVEIRKGLEVGELVVVKGQNTLKDQADIKITENADA